MAESYRVQVWAIITRKNAKGKVTSCRVRWKVGTKEFGDSFKVRAQADSFRAGLISAQRDGVRFDLTTGLPVEWGNATADMTWFEATYRYVEMKWPDLAATARQTTVEALIRVLPAFVLDKPGCPEASQVRSVVRQWGYNPPRRTEENVPTNVASVLEWLSRNTAKVDSATDPEVLRTLQRAVTQRLDGEPYAPTVARRTRSVLSNFLDYAKDELKVVDTNPLQDVKWTKMPKGKRKIDRRAVPNPIQARTLLRTIGETPRSGKRLLAFFASMYFAALRPEEATYLGKEHLALPPPRRNPETGEDEYDWGTIYLERARPYVDALWTDTGTVGEDRPLKSRAPGDVRPVPCPPELTGILWRHIECFGYGPDGRLFVGEQGGVLSRVTYGKVFRAAREATFSAEVLRGPLARRPYDLRHAAVSTQLAAGVSAATVADWAGQSIAVLLEVYASFLDGGEQAARQQVESGLGSRR
ncbi:tyrosine-type recombinase/integrase [Amycolatopsis sp. NPDC059021]|uniref:tyrosine-type recombinase/integrase n=1 Tax=Amycolatopsis sp. NPDC059021 TaxID=3346704 RepID=UPI003670E78F